MDSTAALSFLGGLAVGLLGAFAASLGSYRAAKAARDAARTSAAAALYAAELASTTAQVVVDLSMRGQRLLARDGALRQYRNDQVQPLLLFIARRYGLYRDLQNAYIERDDAHASSLRATLFSAEHVWRDVSFLGVPYQPFIDAVDAFRETDRNLQVAFASMDAYSATEPHPNIVLQELLRRITQIHRVAEEYRVELPNWPTSGEDLPPRNAVGQRE